MEKRRGPGAGKVSTGDRFDPTEPADETSRDRRP